MLLLKSSLALFLTITSVTCQRTKSITKLLKDRSQSDFKEIYTILERLERIRWNSAPEEKKDRIRKPGMKDFCELANLTVAKPGYHKNWKTNILKLAIYDSPGCTLDEIEKAVVGLKDSEQHWCGAVMISDDRGITAGHCFFNHSKCIQDLETSNGRVEAMMHPFLNFDSVLGIHKYDVGSFLLASKNGDSQASLKCLRTEYNDIAHDFDDKANHPECKVLLHNGQSVDKLGVALHRCKDSKIGMGNLNCVTPLSGVIIRKGHSGSPVVCRDRSRDTQWYIVGVISGSEPAANTAKITMFDNSMFNNMAKCICPKSKSVYGK